MTDSILYFTFSPIQPFIGEARRAEDLFSGSSILTELAKAVASQLGELVYPASLKNDAPNVLVAHLTAGRDAQKIGQEAQKAFYEKWQELAEIARHKAKLPEDKTWLEIWGRQTDPQRVWQVYWAAAKMDNGYASAYKLAQSTVDAMKRSRIFQPSVEEGEKDTLSGQRSALRDGKNFKAKDYWKNLRGFSPSKVRPGGTEKLDAIGLIKRFTPHAGKQFFSTSSVAADDYIQKASSELLGRYSMNLISLLDGEPEQVGRHKAWRFDGEWLYEESLTLKALKDFGLEQPGHQKLQDCRRALKELHDKYGKPPAYYAILVFDGDSMGKTISEILEKSTKPEEDHRKFSAKVADFAEKAHKVVDQMGGFGIYIGGDDVLCMAPISKIIPLAQELAKLFKETTGNTASAGIAISHRHSPLGHALETARSAEKIAKKVEGKAALAVSVLRRSGEPLTVRSQWVGLETKIDELQKLFKDDVLSSRLPYAMRTELPAIAGLPVEARKSALKYLFKRHSADAFSEQERTKWVECLNDWADTMNNYLQFEADQSGLDEVTNWLILARFLSSGGAE